MSAHYDERAWIDEAGIAHSVERSELAEAPEEAAGLTQLLALERAARRYPKLLTYWTLGLIWPRAAGERQIALRLLALGPAVLRFRPLDTQRGEWAYEVDGGLLARGGGRLVFALRRDGLRLTLETRMEDFASRIVGEGAPAWRRGLYRYSQLQAHRLVMWLFHLWWQRELAQLMLEADESEAESRLEH